MIHMDVPLESAELLALVRVVDARSFSRAAAELGVPRATIGRRLRRLEERLGTRLLRRTTRSLSLTEAGEVFYRRARIALDAIAEAETCVRNTSNVMRGDLRVSVPPLGDDELLRIITDFAKRHPHVHLQVDCSSRVVDLVREGYDVALRSSADIAPGLIARTIQRNALIAVASPGYLERHGAPETAKDLRRHRCLTGFVRGELPRATWRIGKREVHVESAFSSNEVRLLREAAVQGVGIAQLPRILVAKELEDGVLVQVLPGVVEAENQLAVVYAERELLSPHVRAFIDVVRRWTPLGSTAGAKRRKGRAS
jgi:DNA-binding transcriptional LysR family regulator